LVDNPDTWLAFTDLVLIDPVGTGWSRPAKPDGGSNFWGVHRDAESMAKAIALYVAKNGRVSSPKFILGESYGGFRAAKVARTLQNNQGIVASGILMVSPMIEGALQFGGDHFALGAALQLPSLAAAELERKGTFSTAALAQAEHFALTDYLVCACRTAAPRRCGARVVCARRADDRIAGGRCRPGARFHPRRLCQEFAIGRPQDRQPLRRDVCGRRSEPGIASGPRA
jgi:carboxypeptidase C (cathepsin A)